MKANPILLQKKYARVVELFAKENNVSLEKAFDIYYRSKLYQLMSEGVSDMHCMSDEYLVCELEEECKYTKQLAFMHYKKMDVICIRCSTDFKR